MISVDFFLVKQLIVILIIHSATKKMNNCTRSKKLYPPVLLPVLQYFSAIIIQLLISTPILLLLHKSINWTLEALLSMLQLAVRKNKSLISILPYFYFLVLFWWKNTKCAFRQQRSKTPEHLLQNTPPQLFIRVRTNEVGSKAPGFGRKIVNFCLRPAYAFLHNLTFVCFFFHWMRQMKAFHQ